MKARYGSSWHIIADVVYSNLQRIERTETDMDTVNSKGGVATEAAAPSAKKFSLIKFKKNGDTYHAVYDLKGYLCELTNWTQREVIPHDTQTFRRFASGNMKGFKQI